MKITKAVITAAGRNQRTLPLQTLIDRDGKQKSVLCIIVEEALRANVEEICIVVCPGDEAAYADAVSEHASRLTFVPQVHPLGHGHAVFCADTFVGGQPFLHLVGDHLYVSRGSKGCAEQLVEVAQAESCAVSAVQASRETLLPYYGTVGGRRVQGRQDLYVIEDVIEKPTPTEAEQRLLVPGLRAGHYLCYFGMHVLTPTVMDTLRMYIAQLASEPAVVAERAATSSLRSSASPQGRAPAPPTGEAQAGPSRATPALHPHKTAGAGVTLALALAELATRERYLALERPWWRYDVGVKYGLLSAQVALALSGQDRNEVLAHLLELLALRELHRASS
jgi:UTP--glucose-1-phosphate uridylyltransferase